MRNLAHDCPSAEVTNTHLQIKQPSNGWQSPAHIGLAMPRWTAATGIDRLDPGSRPPGHDAVKSQAKSKRYFTSFLESLNRTRTCEAPAAGGGARGCRACMTCTYLSRREGDGSRVLELGKLQRYSITAVQQSSAAKQCAGGLGTAFMDRNAVVL